MPRAMFGGLLAAASVGHRKKQCPLRTRQWLGSAGALSQPRAGAAASRAGASSDGVHGGSAHGALAAGGSSGWGGCFGDGVGSGADGGSEADGGGGMKIDFGVSAACAAATTHASAGPLAAAALHQRANKVPTSFSFGRGRGRGRGFARGGDGVSGRRPQRARALSYAFSAGSPATSNERAPCC
jgi:hypothetical protein